MEPLIALGVAASVAQFIDFAAKLVGKTRKIALTGSLVSIDHLSALTSNLLDINHSLKVQTKLARAGNAPLTKEEQVSMFSVRQCSAVYLCLGVLGPSRPHRSVRQCSSRAHQMLELTHPQEKLEEQNMDKCSSCPQNNHE